MKRGAMLLRIARALCSPERCANVVEPAIADLQHHGRSIGGYTAFWVSFADCLVQDALAPESRSFLAASAAGLAILTSASFAVEAIAMHWSVTRRLLVLHTRYVYWYGTSSNATLVLALPVAILLASFLARRRAPRASVAAHLCAAAIGVLLTIAATGWIAPARERAEVERAYRAYSGGSRVYTPPLAWVLDRQSTTKALPDLIRSALAPPPHRFPGYPNYVAPEDRFAQEGHWRDLRFRASLVGLSAFGFLFLPKRDDRIDIGRAARR